MARKSVRVLLHAYLAERSAVHQWITRVVPCVRADADRLTGLVCKSSSALKTFLRQATKGLFEAEARVYNRLVIRVSIISAWMIHFTSYFQFQMD